MLQAQPETTSIPEPPYSHATIRQEASYSPRQRLNLGLWAHWTFATTVGGSIGLVLSALISAPVLNAFFGLQSAREIAGNVPALMVLWALMGTVTGLSLGTTQKLALQKVLGKHDLRLWRRLTTAGGGIGLLAFILVQVALNYAGIYFLVYDALGLVPPAISNFIPDAMWNPMSSEVLSFLPLLVLGLTTSSVLGSAQWLALRRYVPNAWWWIPANIVGWIASGSIVFVLSRFWWPNEGSTAELGWTMLAYFLLYLILLGITTGGALAFLLRPLRPLR